MVRSFEFFLEEERKLGKRFTYTCQIYEDRFNREDYNLIEAIWKDGEFINWLYWEVEDLMFRRKVSISSHLIVGDFLFAFSDAELGNWGGVFRNLNRNDYEYKIQERGYINSIFGINQGEYIEFHKYLLNKLSNRKLINKIVIRTNDGKGFKASVYFQLKMEMKVQNWEIQSKKPFSLQKFYEKYYSISSFRRLISSKRNKITMKNREVDMLGVKLANMNEYRLDRKIYDNAFDFINEWGMKLLNESKSSSIEEYFKKFKKMNEDKKLVRFLINESGWNKDSFDFLKNINMEFYLIIKNFSRVRSLNILRQNIWDKAFYLPHFLDLRQRIYANTMLSPTFDLILRYFFRFNINKTLNWEENGSSLFIKKILSFLKEIEEYNLDLKKKYYLLVLFIEVGKEFIEGGKYMYSFEEIIKSGKKAYENREIKSKEKNIHIIKLYMEINKLILNEEIDENMMIYKDATASGLQNYGLLLGYKEEMKPYLNMKGVSWCDTYQFLIDEKLIGEEIFKKRKFWKGTIMTIPYGIGKGSSFLKLLNKLAEEKIFYKKLSKEEQEKLKKMHHDFYDEIKSNIKEIFYKNKKSDFIKFEYRKKIVVNERIYKIGLKDRKGDKRDKYIVKWVTWLEDYEKEKKSEEANNIQHLDSLLMKYMLERMDIMGIHDCFGVRLCELHNLIDNVNLYYGNNDLNSYALFILI